MPSKSSTSRILEQLRGKSTSNGHADNDAGKDYRSAFYGHGVELSGKGEQLEGDCPFCGKEGHLYVNRLTGQWDCKVCGKSGNLSTFLKLLWKESYDQTTDDQYRSLIDERSGVFSLETCKRWRLAKGLLTGEWILPAYNPDGKLSNLYHYVEQRDGKSCWHSTATCNAHPYGVHLLEENTKGLWICEGSWDAMALYTALHKTGALKTEAVLALPGAQQKQYWSHARTVPSGWCLTTTQPVATECKQLSEFSAMPKSFKS